MKHGSLIKQKTFGEEGHSDGETFLPYPWLLQTNLCGQIKAYCKEDIFSFLCYRQILELQKQI